MPFNAKASPHPTFRTETAVNWRSIGAVGNQGRSSIWYTRLRSELIDRPRVHFKPYYIGQTNRVDYQDKPWKTLMTLMQENSHDWIDILKVDVEGFEFSTFSSITDDFESNGVLAFGQL
ncbi:hypothetical protein BGZ51_001173 [Haplosporangium sp. Z 767]|nr:hypothetical protein BGZ51_001173 [Haplosporangium sp. Z 767]